MQNNYSEHIKNIKQMDRYIQHLIEDLKTAAQNPPKPSYFENLPVFEDDLSMAELAMVPFKTIEELTGIKKEAFPNFDELHGRNWKALLDAIFEVFNSLKFKLIDVPKGMPKEWLYEAITSNWDCKVQYLPHSGMDIELCTGDPISCPYGIYCSCGIEWPDDEEYFELKREIPEKYEAFVAKMAKAIDAGLVGYLNANTLVLKTFQREIYDDPEKFGPLVGSDDEECEINIFASYFRVEPLFNFEVDDMMEAFTEQLSDDELKEKLFKILVADHPSERFNALVLPSKERQNWLSFKQAWLEDHVRATIWQEIKYNDALPEGVNGIFNDDGSRIDPSTVPIPSLCMLCKSFYTSDSEENILCLMNRNDQRNDPDFKCGAYESI
jgi:hypothetical protein